MCPCWFSWCRPSTPPSPVRPSVSVEMLPEVAEPEASVTGEPNALPSMLNCTVPVGYPIPSRGREAHRLAIRGRIQAGTNRVLVELT